ncbi:acyltransferase family protein [Candidatus Phycosocius bacilliformis]|nr:acyltransferase [Candidatus Phycosocius bacilliformis]
MNPQLAKARLSSIQSLRGMAAIMVAIAHLHAVENHLGGSPLLGGWALAGFGGVDLFFVISGFVMVWVTRADQGKASALPGFWFSRALRIYPLWWLVLSALVAVWMVKPDWVYQSHASSPELWKSYFLIPDRDLPLHAVGWTLIHELYFYGVFGLLLMLPRRWFAAGLAIWTIICAAAAVILPRPDNPFLAVIRHPLTLEFALGAGIGLLVVRGVRPAANLLIQIGLIWLFISAVAVRSTAADFFAQEWPRVFAFGLPSALLVWGCAGRELAGIESRGWQAKLGDWSYALYLIHVPVFAAVGRLAAPFAQPGPLDNLILLMVGLATAILAAFILHAGFDQPIQKLGRRIRRRFLTPP